MSEEIPKMAAEALKNQDFYRNFSKKEAKSGEYAKAKHKIKTGSIYYTVIEYRNPSNDDLVYEQFSGGKGHISEYYTTGSKSRGLLKCRYYPDGSKEIFENGVVTSRYYASSDTWKPVESEK